MGVVLCSYQNLIKIEKLLARYLAIGKQSKVPNNVHKINYY